MNVLLKITLPLIFLLLSYAVIYGLLKPFHPIFIQKQLGMKLLWRRPQKIAGALVRHGTGVECVFLPL